MTAKIEKSKREKVEHLKSLSKQFFPEDDSIKNHFYALNDDESIELIEDDKSFSSKSDAETGFILV